MQSQFEWIPQFKIHWFQSYLQIESYSPWHPFMALAPPLRSRSCKGISHPGSAYN